MHIMCYDSTCNERMNLKYPHHIMCLQKQKVDTCITNVIKKIMNFAMKSQMKDKKI